MKILDEWVRKLRELVGRLMDDGGGVDAHRLLKAVLAEMEQRSERLLASTWAPDRYRVFLPPDKLAALGPLAPAVRTELTEQVRKHAARRGYRLAGPVDLELVADESLDPGAIRVEGAFVGDPARAVGEDGAAHGSDAAEGGREGEERQDRQTRLVEPERETRLRVAAWELEVLDGPDTGRVVAIGDLPVTVGRGKDADIRIEDPSEYLSRVHARFRATEDGLLVEDLGSANGTEIDGRRIREEQVTGEVEILLGGVRIRCRPPAGENG